jgi:hypothetical protein
VYIPYQKWNENRFRYIYISSHCGWVAGLYNIQQQDLSHPHSYRNNATSVFIQRKQLDKYIQQCAQDAPRGAVHTNQKNRPTTFFFLFSFWCASITPRGYFQHKKEKVPDVAAPISGRGNILCGIGLYYHLWIKKKYLSHSPVEIDDVNRRDLSECITHDSLVFSLFWRLCKAGE